MKRRTSLYSAMAAAAALSVAAAAMTIPAAQAATGAVAAPCTNIESVFARGSGQVAGAPGKEAEIFANSLSARLGAPITVNSYELGSEAIDGHQYPAVPAPNLLGPPAAPGSTISAAYAFTYSDSIAEGVAELNAYVSARAAACPDTAFVLAGYSQGAQVTGTAYNAMEPALRARVLYSALLGDPNLSLPEGSGAFPTACQGEGPFSAWRQGVPTCTTSTGSLGARVPYVPAGTSNTGTWCNSHDFICGSSKALIDGAGHGLYGTPVPGLQTPIDAVTQEIANRVVAAAPAVAPFVNAGTVRTAPVADAPFAAFDQDAYSAPLDNGTITFSATKSYSPNSTVVSYGWDFDADGIIDATTTEPTVSHTFTAPYAGHAAVTVTDALGNSSRVAVPFAVGASLQPPAPSAAVNVVAVRNAADPTTATITWQPVDATAALWGVTVNGAFAGIYLGSAAPVAVVSDIPNDGDIVVGITPITAATLIGTTTNTVLEMADVTTPTATPTETESATPTATPSETESATPTETPTETESATPSASATVTTPAATESTTPATTSARPSATTRPQGSVDAELASTGANNVGWWLGGGAGALVLGAGALLLMRRRH